MKALPVIGRILYTAIFISSSFQHFTGAMTAYAKSAGVPAAGAMVPLSGLVMLAGALMILFGFYPRAGAWLIVLFLVPVTFAMHRFWAIPDPQAAQTQMIMFMKNLSMLGAALMIAYFGTGPMSVKDATRTERSA